MNMSYKRFKIIIESMLHTGFMHRALGEDCYEDCGGHTWHESNIDEELLQDYLRGLDEEERAELLAKLEEVES